MNPTQNQVTDDTVTPSQVLRDAALYLSRHGWTKGSLYESAGVPTPPASALGAIFLTATGRKLECVNDIYDADFITVDTIVVLSEALCPSHDPADPTHECFEDEDYLGIDWWNDLPFQTAETVIGFLRVLATEMDGQQ